MIGPDTDPFDHNGECCYCDEQGGHDADCAWIASLLRWIAELEAEVALLRKRLAAVQSGE